MDAAAIQHLLDEFGLDAAAIAVLAALGTALNELTPEALQAARGESALCTMPRACDSLSRGVVETSMSFFSDVMMRCAVASLDSSTMTSPSQTLMPRKV